MSYFFPVLSFNLLRFNILRFVLLLFRECTQAYVWGQTHKEYKATFPSHSLNYCPFNIECDACSMVLKHVSLEQGLPKR